MDSLKAKTALDKFGLGHYPERFPWAFVQMGAGCNRRLGITFQATSALPHEISRLTTEPGCTLYADPIRTWENG